MNQCTHPEVHIIETTAWNGQEWKTYYHCQKCGRVLKKQKVMMANKHVKIQYVVQESFKAQAVST